MSGSIYLPPWARWAQSYISSHHGCSSALLHVFVIGVCFPPFPTLVIERHAMSDRTFSWYVLILTLISSFFSCSAFVRIFPMIPTRLFREECSSSICREGIFSGVLFLIRLDSSLFHLEVFTRKIVLVVYHFDLIEGELKVGRLRRGPCTSFYTFFSSSLSFFACGLKLVFWICFHSHMWM